VELFREKMTGHWAQYLSQFPFEWWLTLTFKEPVRSECAKGQLKSWTRKLIKQERIQLAYFGVINEVNRIHLHLLALGRNRQGKTLLDVSVAKWERALKSQAKVSPIYDITGVAEYFERNTILRNQTLSEIILYNIKLLKKVENARCIEKLKSDDHTHPILSEIVCHTTHEEKSVKSHIVAMIDGLIKREANRV
jgi:hypothetical protein